MNIEYPNYVPKPTPPELFSTYQLAYEFHREAQVRQDHQEYCQWYNEAAQRHQQEYQRMQGDINLFGCFLRKKQKKQQ
ncbi:MAG: hypothetical protein F6K03_13635 [Kamptonema sp. SIO4C4]|nr:hypothetical protein [Kamptonema sp. SIO4C4]